MRLLKIIVDKLPDNCFNCLYAYDHYCEVKGSAIESGQRFVDRWENIRDKDCPLEIE